MLADMLHCPSVSRYLHPLRLPAAADRMPAMAELNAGNRGVIDFAPTHSTSHGMHAPDPLR